MIKSIKRIPFKRMTEMEKLALKLVREASGECLSLTQCRRDVISYMEKAEDAFSVYCISESTMYPYGTIQPFVTKLLKAEFLVRTEKIRGRQLYKVSDKWSKYKRV